MALNRPRASGGEADRGQGVSNNDSFIDEVSDEVRRDQLYGYLRRYGWIAIAAVVLLVGGAAYTEIRSSQAESAAQALGDDILAALEAEEPAARAEGLAALAPEGEAAVVVSFLQAAESLAAEDPAAAAEALNALADAPETPPLYKELARLKALMTGALPPEERIARLQTLASPGAPFRLLAAEQIVFAQIEMGATEEAIAGLRAILEDAALTTGLRERAQGLIVALGEDLTPDGAAAE